MKKANSVDPDETARDETFWSYAVCKGILFVYAGLNGLM